MNEREGDHLFEEIAVFLRQERQQPPIQLPEAIADIRPINLDPPKRPTRLARHWKEAIAAAIVVGTYSSLATMMGSHAIGNTDLLQTSFLFFNSTLIVGGGLILTGNLIQNRGFPKRC